MRPAILLFSDLVTDIVIRSIMVFEEVLLVHLIPHQKSVLDLLGFESSPELHCHHYSHDGIALRNIQGRRYCRG